MFIAAHSQEPKGGATQIAIDGGPDPSKRGIYVQWNIIQP